MYNEESYICRICGLIHTFCPWGEDNLTASFEICDCCGVEFGYEDCNIIAVKNYRQEWLDKGAQWFHKEYEPSDWSLDKQLMNIPNKWIT